MAATATLTSGDVTRIKSKEEFANGVVLRVSELQEVTGKKHKCMLSDGNSSIRGVLASQFADLVSSGELSNGCLVRITSFVTNTVGSDEVLLATDLSVVSPGTGIVKMEVDNALNAHNSTPEAAGKPQAKSSAAGPDAKENSTPGPDFKTSKTPGPGLSPMSFFSPAPTPTGAGIKSAPTPPSTMGVSDRKNHHKIAQLHPYDTNWCIRAKVERKAPLRALPSKPDVKLLTVDLVDETGTAIQGTFWRGPAERMSEQLVEGKVYVFHKFKVKPADKKYSSVKNEYQIDFTDTTDVSEAADQDTSAMTTAVDITPIDQLPRRIGQRAPADVMGVVLALGNYGTVKRKADNSELPRREVTIGDQSGKSVAITLWGDLSSSTAQQLEGMEGRAVLQVTGCRVTDYNGCSVSTLSKSVATINPETPAAQQMMLWYKTAEMNPDRFTAVGADLMMARGSQGGSQGGAGGVPARERYLTLKDVSALSPESEALANDKAVFQNVTACVAMVNNDDKNIFYLANPENGRKVVDQGGGRYWSEADGKAIEKPEHRYLLSVRLADHTGETNVQLFGKEAEAVMGMRADELAALKEAGGEGFAGALKAAQWKAWQVVVMTKAREYNGNRSVRHSAYKVENIDWVSESSRLVNLIAKYGN
ncbi:hypothetical protein HYH02_003700 [Chlamydomonas schloesseri]|uniref:Replication protein A subunit n=1 Tax=Chlamydomonas schloesseri TaxID=2026947 RepID=A0A836BA60_9CHLO|nr:hypothetical protein HYH02_003700 [Chlamydomonas schloesseri]|eukprot:KAG2451925.1 hypothetical protein HYH02_003700 [Chlamydomonas schloesseri]